MPGKNDKSVFTPVEFIRFHLCGGLVKLVCRPVYVHGKIVKAVFTPVWSFEARIGLFICLERSTK